MTKHTPLQRTAAVSMTASFGHGSSPILPWNIQCIGDELTLSNCSFTEYDPEECQQVAGVICEGVFFREYITGNHVHV